MVKRATALESRPPLRNTPKRHIAHQVRSQLRTSSIFAIRSHVEIVRQRRLASIFQRQIPVRLDLWFARARSIRAYVPACSLRMPAYIVSGPVM